MKWISVKERLPEENTPVLVFKKDFRTGKNCQYVAWLENAVSNQWEYSHCCGCTTTGITHWAELELPKDCC